MKRCPECRRDYYYDTLLYCLDDGNALLEGPVSADEPATAILSEPSALAGGSYAQNDKTRIFESKATETKPESGTPNNSIAVLPFANFSNDAENEYFCDGLAEELLTAKGSGDTR